MKIENARLLKAFEKMIMGINVSFSETGKRTFSTKSDEALFITSIHEDESLDLVNRVGNKITKTHLSNIDLS